MITQNINAKLRTENHVTTRNSYFILPRNCHNFVFNRYQHEVKCYESILVAVRLLGLAPTGLLITNVKAAANFTRGRAFSPCFIVSNFRLNVVAAH